MATYNGAKYIENQILSLIQQTYKNWQLIIHDDGSSDETIQIIDYYAKLDNRIKLIKDEWTGLRAGKNFLHALQFSQADYAIFCDQDDIWLENKVEELVNALEKQNDPTLPILVYCDGYAWDSQGNIHSESISSIHAEHLSDFIMLNGGYQGCSIIMNKLLIEMAKQFKGVIHHHDDLVCLIAHTFGKVHFLPKQLMLYRQHNMAVTGNKSFEKKALGGILNNVGFVVSRKHFEFKKSFYDFYSAKLSEVNKVIFNSYFDYCNLNTKLSRALFLLRSNLTWGGSKFKLLGKTLLQDLFDQ